MHFDNMTYMNKAKQQLKKQGYVQIYNSLKKEVWKKDNKIVELFYDGSF